MRKKSKAIADKALTKLRRIAETEEGRAAIKGSLEKRFGKTVQRQLIERWIHKDPERRTEPLLGAGLVLIEIADQIESKNLCRETAKK